MLTVTIHHLLGQTVIWAALPVPVQGLTDPVRLLLCRGG